MDPRDHQSTVVSADEVGVTTLDLQRLAIQIAEGHLSFPCDLDLEGKQRLARLVRGRRRDQLVRYLARQVAITFARRCEMNSEGMNYVEVGL